MPWWIWGAIIWVGLGVLMSSDKVFQVREDRSEAEAFLLDSIEFVVCLPIVLVMLLHNVMRRALTSAWNNPI